MAREMDDQQLVEIRQLLHYTYGVTKEGQEALAIAKKLMREVDILRGNMERLRAREAALVEIAEAVVANGHKALRGHNFDCWYCGNQPFKRFEPGGVIEAGWEHAPDCPVTKARALLAEGEGQ